MKSVISSLICLVSLSMTVGIIAGIISFCVERPGYIVSPLQAGLNSSLSCGLGVFSIGLCIIFFFFITIFILKKMKLL
jgi:hypothetical protein